MIVVYNTTTGAVVMQGEFDPTGQVPDGCDFVDLGNVGPLSRQRIDPKTRLPVWLEGYGPEREQWNFIRRYRNGLLADTDYLIMPDYPLTDESRAALQAYRDALRDVTDQADPTNIVWPVMPAIVKKSA